MHAAGSEIVHLPQFHFGKNNKKEGKVITTGFRSTRKKSNANILLTKELGFGHDDGTQYEKKRGGNNNYFLKLSRMRVFFAPV